MILSNKRITKVLIRLRRCAGWGAPLLFANHRRQVFSRHGPYSFQWAGMTSIPISYTYSKTCLKQPLSKRPKFGFQDQLLLNTNQKYCRMFQGEHSAILSTFIKLPFVIKTFVFSIFERLITVHSSLQTETHSKSLDTECLFCIIIP